MKAETLSFEEILREKIIEFSSENTAKNTDKSPSSASSAHSGFSREIRTAEELFTHKINFEPVIFGAKKYSRSASLTAKKVDKVTKTPSKEAVVSVNSLSKEAFLALEMMKRLGSTELNTNEISMSLVKKSFRRLCLVYHPDKILNSASPREIQELSLNFSQLKKAKDELEKYFAKQIPAQTSQEAA